MSEYCVVLAARMSSDRLPGKALAELAHGIRVLPQVISRWQSSDRNPVVVCTTTTDPADDVICIAASAARVPVSRLPAGNTVAEMDAAVKRYAPGAQYIARALADNPLVDVALADWHLDVLRDTGANGIHYGTELDEYGNERGRQWRITYAGTTDIWSRAAWDRIVAESSGSELMHPGQHYWNNLPSYFPTMLLPLPWDEYRIDKHPNKTELDTPEDLEMFRQLWRAWRGPDLLPTAWALGYLRTHPDTTKLNVGVPIKTQSSAIYPAHFKRWACPDCGGRMGSLIQGNLRVYCQTCGQPKTYYSAKSGPKR